MHLEAPRPADVAAHMAPGAPLLPHAARLARAVVHGHHEVPGVQSQPGLGVQVVLNSGAAIAPNSGDLEHLTVVENLDAEMRPVVLLRPPVQDNTEDDALLCVLNAFRVTSPGVGLPGHVPLDCGPGRPDAGHTAAGVVHIVAQGGQAADDRNGRPHAVPGPEARCRQDPPRGVVLEVPAQIGVRLLHRGAGDGLPLLVANTLQLGVIRFVGPAATQRAAEERHQWAGRGH
mmetsp:Transcript_109531/g.316667  ORF Transcript_109531/g.316667 Transcript_109531/m.316667 type:complete len:231 (+) Transcript_109531:181-873(+)